MSTWDWAVAWDAMPALLLGLLVTVEAVAAGMVIALVLGLVWTLARRSGRRLVRWPVGAVVEVVRNTPLLVQLYLLYYFVLPQVGIMPSPFLTGVVGLGLHYSAYTSEVYRAGIESVRPGQWEAALSLDLTPVQTWRHVILPQAIPPVIPALGNDLVSMFKKTPLLAAITVVEVLTRALNYGSEHFRYLEPLTLVGLMYLILSLLAGAGARWLETHFKLER